KNGCHPLSVSLKVPGEVTAGTPFTATLVLANRGSTDVEGIVVEPIEVAGVRFLDEGPISVGSLRTHTEASVGLRCTLIGAEHDRSSQTMVATRTRWKGATPQDQYVNFAYIRGRAKNVLTR
ncbi:MAG: hypothetical protein ACE5OR_11285, partial [bacterium]